MTTDRNQRLRLTFLSFSKLLIIDLQDQKNINNSKDFSVLFSLIHDYK